MQFLCICFRSNTLTFDPYNCKMKDQIIFDLIERERVRQTNGLELIASENYVSDEVMQAMGSVLTNKYAEGLPKKRYYGGCEVVDEVEAIVWRVLGECSTA